MALTPVAYAVSGGVRIVLKDVKWIPVLFDGFYIMALVMGTIKEKSLNIIQDCMFASPVGRNTPRWQWVNVEEMLGMVNECVRLVSIVYSSIRSKESRELILKSVDWVLYIGITTVR